MQFTHVEWQEIASTVAQHEGIGATMQASKKAWRELSIIATLLLGSVGERLDRVSRKFKHRCDF